jgi:hypothetical protein
MICQCCGREAPTKYVAFYQNIGAIAVRFTKSVEGKLCKSCVHGRFWSMTGTTFFLGWWGVISFLVTPFILLNNIGRYLFCLGMAPVPPDATQPTLTKEAIERIDPHAQQFFDRLNGGEDFQTVVGSTAELAGVTPAQVVLFAQAVVEAQKQK